MSSSINVRGTFAMTRACLPHMENNSFGRIVNMSPPIRLDAGAYAGMTAYNISKYGMTSAYYYSSMHAVPRLATAVQG